MMHLARALVPLARRALSLPATATSEDGTLLAGALDSIDGFLANPVASRYLIAARALGALTQLRRRSTEMTLLSRRSLDAELDRLHQRAVLPDSAALDLLRALPPDPRAGRRLQALGALLEAHRALALRVRAPETHRARIQAPAKTKPPQPRQKERRAPR